jgi:hypothetical protein
MIVDGDAALVHRFVTVEQRRRSLPFGAAGISLASLLLVARRPQRSGV